MTHHIGLINHFILHFETSDQISKPACVCVSGRSDGAGWRCFSEWTHWSSESLSPALSDPAQLPECFYWGIITLPHHYTTHTNIYTHTGLNQGLGLTLLQPIPNCTMCTSFRSLKHFGFSYLCRNFTIMSEVLTVSRWEGNETFQYFSWIFTKLINGVVKTEKDWIKKSEYPP